MSFSLSSLSPEDLAYLQILMDPVLWAEKTLGWIARPYQAEFLRDPSKRIVLRQGRRTGKTDSICVKCLYCAFTQPGGRPGRDYRILIIAPQDEHVNEIFSRLRELIRQSEDLSESVVMDKKHPNIIRFGNNSVIRGVTAGTKSGRKALAVRGKGADMLIFDEMDYLDDDDVANSYAITMEHPDVIVIGASTPTGRRSYFYRWCMDKSLGFKEYHVPATMNPNWNEEMERDLRAQYSGVKYLQEVMAEFGEEEMGVIAKRFIDSAVLRGQQLGLRYQNRFNPLEKRGPRILGVDWDKYGASTHMIALEFDRVNTHLYYPIFYHEVPKHRFTLTQGIQDVLDLDAAFDFDYIIVDRGYGEAQVEELKKYGLLNPESRLAEKVIGISLSDHVFVRDPFTRKKIKQPLKPFMINQLALAFEQERFALVPDDYNVIKHLEDFRVVSVSSYGQPTYTSEDDHIFITIAMAYYGFVMNYSDLMNLKPATAILPFRSPLQKVADKTVPRELPQTNAARVLVSSTVLGSVGIRTRSSGLVSRRLGGASAPLRRRF